MAIDFPSLPYPIDSLAPHISERTLSYHHGKHHSTYVANLNKMIANTGFESSTLEDVIAAAEMPSGLFNNAAQSWNHTFYWESMTPGAVEEPSSELKSALDASFGSLDAFTSQFTAKAVGNFASGWTWLVATNDSNGSGGLAIVNTDDADTPLRHGYTPLLTIDVWEHAYYLDYQNARAAYAQTFMEKLVNWEFASNNFSAVSA